MDLRCEACGLNLVNARPWTMHRCADGAVRPITPGLSIGDGVQIHGNVTLGPDVSICGPADINGKDSSIEIGAGCDIAAFVTISCADSHLRCIGRATEIERSPIVIGASVFIGQGATILGGCIIGDRSVIGAGVVMKAMHVPPWSRVYLPRPIVNRGYYKP